MSIIARRLTALKKLGALSFAMTVATKHGVGLGKVLDMTVKEPTVRRARRELFVVTMHTLGLGYSETARALDLDHTTLMMAERRWREDLPATAGVSA